MLYYFIKKNWCTRKKSTSLTDELVFFLCVWLFNYSLTCTIFQINFCYPIISNLTYSSAFLHTFRFLRGLVPLQLKVIYNTIDLLDIMKSNSTFKLIQYVNQTTLYELITTKHEWHHNLILAKSSLGKFRNSSNFGKTIYIM